MFDALAVWVSYVEFDRSLSEDEFLRELVLAKHHIIGRVVEDHSQAAEIADMIVEAIEINFK